MSSLECMAQALDSSGYMKNLTSPVGMAAIFHDAIRIHILHSASPMNPRIQVSSERDRVCRFVQAGR